jgi:osmotically-inducible protein OsmY
MKTDTQLKRDVEEELGWEPRVNAAEIGVAVVDGVVTLTGHVDSWAEKSAAERAVKRVEGVVAVAEEIQVRVPGISQRTDADIARSAASSVSWNTWVPKDTVTVKVEHGWLTLEGEVQARYQKDAAEEAVRGLLGVNGVSNQIVIKPKVKPGNVKDAIQRAFARSATIDAGKVGIDVHGGRVTLHGTVRSWVERQDAETATWAAPGVVEVQNLLRVA